MSSFLKDLSGFYGTGEKNAQGKTLEEFLEDYNPRKYETPSCTVDNVILAHEGIPTVDLEGMKILLVKRSNHPSIGCWALPGGFVEMRENLEEAAKRELQEETGVTGVRMEPFAVYGDYDRDPRTRVITTAFMALIRAENVRVQAGDDAACALWCDLTFREEMPEKTETGVTRYRIGFKNKEKGLDTSALVERRCSGGLIRDEKFIVKEPGMTAVDHAAIITQALTILKERLEESCRCI